MTTWGAILAGGDGTRLKAVTSAFAGDNRPKQFCRLLSGDTLFGETRQRVALSVAARRTLFVLTRTHRPYYVDELLTTREPHLIEQPANRGTAIAVAFALGRLLRLDAGAVLALFPADHYYARPQAVHCALATALRAARLEPRRLVLVGAEAERPETAYGWIVPRPRRRHAESGCVAVLRFHEKPSLAEARKLMAAGGLWNTFITVGTATAFMNALGQTLPDLHAFAKAVLRSPTALGEATLAARAYGTLTPACFSSAVLARCPERCLAVPMADAGWLDVGEPGRLIEARRQVGWAFARRLGRPMVSGAPTPFEPVVQRGPDRL